MISSTEIVGPWPWMCVTFQIWQLEEKYIACQCSCFLNLALSISLFLSVTLFCCGRCYTSRQNQISCPPICLYYEPLSNASDSHSLPSAGTCLESQTELNRPNRENLAMFSCVIAVHSGRRNKQRQRRVEMPLLHFSVMRVTRQARRSLICRLNIC